MLAPEALKKWREKKGLSQAQASEDAGVSAATWCDWEHGKKSPTVDRAQDLEKQTDRAVTVTMWARYTRARREERRAKKKVA